MWESQKKRKSKCALKNFLNNNNNIWKKKINGLLEILVRLVS